MGWDLLLLGLGLHIASGGGTLELEAVEGWTASDPAQDTGLAARLQSGAQRPPRSGIFRSHQSP